MVKTGVKRGRIPKFHDEMHKFVKYRHIFNPVALQCFGLKNCADPGMSNINIGVVDESDFLSEN